MEENLVLSGLKYFCENSLHLLVIMNEKQVLYANAKTRQYFENSKSIKDILPRCMEKNLGKRLIKKIRLRNGELLVIRWHIFTLLPGKIRPLVLLMGEDITEQQALQKRLNLLSYLIIKVPDSLSPRD